MKNPARIFFIVLLALGVLGMAATGSALYVRLTYMSVVVLGLHHRRRRREPLLSRELRGDIVRMAVNDESRRAMVEKPRVKRQVFAVVVEGSFVFKIALML